MVFCVSYVDVQEGRSSTKGAVVLYLGDRSVCLSSSYKHKTDSKLIFSFSLTALEVGVDGKIFLPGGRRASEVC